MRGEFFVELYCPVVKVLLTAVAISFRSSAVRRSRMIGRVRQILGGWRSRRFRRSAREAPVVSAAIQDDFSFHLSSFEDVSGVLPQ